MDSKNLVACSCGRRPSMAVAGVFVDDPRRAIKCFGCGTEMGWFPSVGIAVVRWNERHFPTAMKKLVAESDNVVYFRSRVSAAI